MNVRMCRQVWNKICLCVVEDRQHNAEVHLMVWTPVLSMAWEQVGEKVREAKNEANKQT